MKKILQILLFLSSQTIFGQHVSGTDVEVMQPFYEEAFTNVFAESRNDDSLTIPIVFHILEPSGDEKVTDSVLQLQVGILNKDFNGGAESERSIREDFEDVKGISKIKFVIHKIIRKNFDERIEAPFSGIFDDVNKIKLEQHGGSPALSPHHFLNIWVCNFTNDFLNVGNVAGYANPLVKDDMGDLILDEQLDGVVIDRKYIGRYYLPIIGEFYRDVRGHSLTHEIGHYLGLVHTFGNSSGSDCGDDGLDDTPITSLNNSIFSCNHSIVPCGEFTDMSENFMSYSDEVCQLMFTKDQVEVMRYMLKTVRATLVGNESLATSNEALEVDLPLEIYPNPVSENINFRNPLPQGSVVSIIDFTGKINSYNLINNSSLDISKLESGIYFLQVKGEKVNSVTKFIKK